MRRISYKVTSDFWFDVPCLIDIISDIRTSILNEVDFRKEAEHLQVTYASQTSQA